VVLKAIVAELNSETRARLLTTSPPSKVALFKMPEQVWTDIPEHSVFKGEPAAQGDFSGKFYMHCWIDQHTCMHLCTAL
jgi:hypothetical protein